MIFLFHSLPTFADHHLTKSRFKPTLTLKVLKVASLFQVNPISILLINAIDISDPDVENHILPKNPNHLFLYAFRKFISVHYKT